MINEYYLGLTNPPKGGYSAPGSDYVPTGWQKRKLSNEARAVQRALLVDPANPTSSNWRSVELRKLTEKSDLNSIMTSFDGRTGYLLNELLYNMTKYLQPQVAGAFADQVQVHGRLTLPTYELSTWTVTIGASDWTISGKDDVTGPIISGRSHATLPGTEAAISFPTVQEGQFVLTWASKPELTAVETAKELKRALGGEVDSLANQPSQLSVDDCRLLRSVILGKAEAPAKVVAGSLLLAGHTLAAPVED